ncbi:MAG: glutamyl-tRNA reductase [Planctomycetota bacterium]
MQLRMVGCSHHRSAVGMRERLAFTPEQTAEALEGWRTWHPELEAVLLSTCNRVEFYAAADGGGMPPCPGLMTRRLAESHNLPVEEVRSHVVTLRDEEVVDHLFRVAASLDSMVVGEPQILAQVKQAYELANQMGSTGPLTHGCFQAALRVAKRVAGETDLHRHRVSIPSVAINDFAAEIFERFDDKRVLVIGAGEMADETLRYLADGGARRVTLVNRNAERAESLADEWRESGVDATAAPIDDLPTQLGAADLVISTTAAGEPVVTLDAYRQKVAPVRDQRPLFVLDLAMPRDFDPRIGDELGVYLYSIDDLVEACDRNRAMRERAIPAAERIVTQERDQFLVDARGRLSAPVIARLRSEFTGPKNDELQRLFNKLPELDEHGQKEIEQFADRLVNKMLHPAMESLRAESQSGSPSRLLNALSRLFQLKE